ncbi:PstS family phosphate ABC transporter substrate-binding protein [Oceanobacillus sojae]|uniref:PstS family phosphate ABC transporter substrate-binding protein n=1 Tax=Oceanobacillus sojae TaxID=582851 RepID=UPI0009886188|nr:PstS family phosphate ABC transporter substrate-binding protein [Oceanobacillus sojae]MCT1901341.1 PstS family phosphate ABC transporter substrate-binding protein [Oceanobacillus sojae]
MSFKRFTLFFFVSVLIFLAACGSGDADGAEDSGSESDSGEELSGSVAIDGSGTVYPLMARLAEDYMINEQQGVSVEVSRAGTSAGFEKFLNENGTDFNDASREIKEEEQAKADELGFEVQELKVALDGLTIVTHPDNDWATELTPEQIQGIFLGEYTKWSDIDDSWPNEDIKTYGPNENHGTYEFFYETILEEQDLVEGIDLQQDYSTLVTLVSEDKNAIGFFGFGYYQSNQDAINAVSIDFGEGAVEPSLDTIAEDGPYADYTRPVFTYLNVNHAQEKPEVLDYAKYVLENANNVAGETGFAPIPDEEVQSQLEALEGIK